MASVRGMNKVESDMDEHGKLKAEIKVVIKECMDALASKDDKVISAAIKKKCDEKFGPTWNVIVGEDYKAAFAHENKHFVSASDRGGERAAGLPAAAAAAYAGTGAARAADNTKSSANAPRGTHADPTPPSRNDSDLHRRFSS